jgi:hypothetical protein
MKHRVPIAGESQIAYSLPSNQSGQSMTRRVRALPRQTVSVRKWLTLAVLLAFFLQTWAVQTHIHGPAETVAAKTVTYKVPAPVPAKSQDINDQCRLCQELVHAGNFITPSALAMPASQAFVLVATSTFVLAAPAPATGFAWQSRAPPRP